MSARPTKKALPANEIYKCSGCGQGYKVLPSNTGCTSCGAGRDAISRLDADRDAL